MSASDKVYLVKSNDLYKIGSTNNVPRRVAELKTYNSAPLDLVTSVFHQDALKVEKDLHFLHVPENSHGEWFKLNEEQVKDFDKLVSDDKYREKKLEEYMQKMDDHVFRNAHVDSSAKTVPISQFQKSIHNHLPRQRGESVNISVAGIPTFSVMALSNYSNGGPTDDKKE